MKKSIKILAYIATVSFFIYSCGDQSSKKASKELGMSADSLKAAYEIMQDYVDENKLSGISTMVLKDGHIVHRSLHGFADLEKAIEMQEKQLFRIFSMSKPITTVALMKLYDEGMFDLDDPLAEYIPEFSDTKVYLEDTQPAVFIPQNEPITIRHLLTHTAGFTYGWYPYNYVDSVYSAMDPPLWQLPDLEQFVEKVSELPLKYQPGYRWEYSISIDIAGYLVEVLSGIPFDEYLRKSVFEPLNMEDTYFHVPDSSQHRLSMIYTLDYNTAKLSSLPFWIEEVKKPVTLFSGGGGLVSSLEDYSRFAQMLLNYGILDGNRILEESTTKLILSNQLPEGIEYLDNEGYGLGGSVNMENGIYGWSGMASTYFWVYPDEDLAILCFTQFIPSEKYPFAFQFKDKVLASIKK